MLPPDLTASLVTAAKWALLVLAGFLISWVISLVVDPIGVVLDEVRSALAAFRRRLADGPLRRLTAAVQSIWQSYRDEYDAFRVLPLISLFRNRLGRLRAAVQDFGKTQIGTLSQLQARASGDLRAIAKLPALPPLNLDQAALSAAALYAARRWLYLILFVLLVIGTVAIGTLNATLLGQFFKPKAPGFVLYTPVELPTSLAVAILFAVAETLLGLGVHLVYWFARDEEDGPLTYLRLIPWIGIGALALIEFVAYMTLSAKMNLAAELEVAPDSPWYDIVQYFMAFFGLAISLVLALLGYFLWAVFDRLLRTWRTASLIRALTRYARLFDDRKIVERLASTLEAVKGAWASLEKEAVQRFSQSVGTSAQSESALAILSRKLEETETTDATPRRPATAAGEVIACLILLLFFLALACVCYLNFRASLAPTAGLLSLPGLLAFLLAAGIAASGWFLRLVTVGSDLSPRLTSQLQDPVLRWALAILLGAVVFASGAYLTVQSFVNNGTLGSSVALNVVAGIFLPAALLAFSAFFDMYLRAAYFVAVLVAYGTAIIGVCLAWATANVLDALLYAVHMLLRLLAVGGMLLRARKPEPAS